MQNNVSIFKGYGHVHCVYFSDETAILKCKVQGNPVPTVKWSKGLREVSSDISVLLATIICHFNVFLKGKGK